MRLIECLKQLPSNMVMIDILEIDKFKRFKTVAQIIEQNKNHWNEDGYELRVEKYGKISKKVIGLINDTHIYIEADRRNNDYF
jgi:hypothetical protein